MRIILALLVVSLNIFLSIKSSTIVYAQQWCGGCEVGQGYEDPETGQWVYIDGCNGCVATPCPPGKYEAPNGECYPVGTGGACACGAKADGSCKDCGVDVFDFRTCDGGTVLACANPPELAAGCTYKATCSNEYFPSAFFHTDCAGEDKPNRGICQDNCECCLPGQEYVKLPNGSYTCQNVCGLEAPRVTVSQGASASQAIVKWVDTNS